MTPVTRTRPQTVGLVLLLLAASVYFLWRGVWRGIAGSEDLTYGYAAAQAWLRGSNPYDAQVLEEIVTAARWARDPDGHRDHGVYFPPALPIFVPIALGDWDTAKMIWLVINVVATASR